MGISRVYPSETICILNLFCHALWLIPHFLEQALGLVVPRELTAFTKRAGNRTKIKIKDNAHKGTLQAWKWI